MLIRLYILFFIFFGVGCKEQEDPEISFDKNTIVEYKTWGGEFGSGSTSLSIYGDGSVVYVQNLPQPYNNTPTITRDLKLDKEETIGVFNLLLNAGLLRLKSHAPTCCDLPGAQISGEINSQSYSALCQLDCGSAWELVRSQFGPLLVRLHPERWGSTNAD